MTQNSIKPADGNLYLSVLRQAVSMSNAQNCREEGDTVGEDGLLICGKCGTKKQFRAVVYGEEITGFCLCECKTEQREREKEEQARQEKIKRVDTLRRECIADAGCREWRFENDKEYRPEISKAARRYVERWDSVKERNAGLLFYGDVGTGKSFIAYCIANALIDKGISALATNFSRIISEIQKTFGGSDILDDIASAELLILDDFGAERDTTFGTEKVFEVIDTRIRASRPMIITTNLSPEDFKNADIRYKRIHDRILSVCSPVRFAGKSIRREEKQERAGLITEIGF